MSISSGYLNSNPQFKKGFVNHNIFLIKNIVPTIQELVGVFYPSNSYKGEMCYHKKINSFANLINENSNQPFRIFVR